MFWSLDGREEGVPLTGVGDRCRQVSVGMRMRDLLLCSSSPTPLSDPFMTLTLHHPLPRKLSHSLTSVVSPLTSLAASSQSPGLAPFFFF